MKRSTYALHFVRRVCAYDFLAHSHVRWCDILPVAYSTSEFHVRRRSGVHGQGVQGQIRSNVGWRDEVDEARGSLHHQCELVAVCCVYNEHDGQWGRAYIRAFAVRDCLVVSHLCWN